MGARFQRHRPHRRGTASQAARRVRRAQGRHRSLLAGGGAWERLPRRRDPPRPHSGKGWPPLNPQGHFSLWVFEKLARGEEIALPHLGLATFHRVHADSVARGFQRALENWDHAAGQSFHIVSDWAVTQRGYAETVAYWFGKEARLCFLPWEEIRRTVTG